MPVPEPSTGTCTYLTVPTGRYLKSCTGVNVIFILNDLSRIRNTERKKPIPKVSVKKFLAGQTDNTVPVPRCTVAPNIGTYIFLSAGLAKNTKFSSPFDL